MTAPVNAAALVSSESSATEQSRREFQARLNGIGSLGGRKVSPEAREKKLREACEGFESVFIQKMWQEMRNTIPKGGLMHGKEERFWQDMYDQELSKSMTSAGGIGLADMMYAQLSRNLVSASRSAAGSKQGRAFAPEAAPLLNAASDAPVSEPVVPTAQAAIYDGAAPEAAEADMAEKTAPAVDVAGQEAVKGTVKGTAVATVPVEKPANASEEAMELNPEVELALAALRTRQAMQRQEEANVQQAVQVVAPPKVQSASRRKQSLASSGIELAQRARREAGDKLGPRAVRPPLQQPSQRHSADTIESPQAAPAEGIGHAASLADAERVQQANPQNVRISTNMQPAERARRGLKPIRTLNVDNVGANSKAGAGIAAYHAASEAQANARAASEIQPVSQTAPQTAQAAQPETAASANFGIPPLTARDARI